jgi:hypothetical protein
MLWSNTEHPELSKQNTVGVLEPQRKELAENDDLKLENEDELIPPPQEEIAILFDLAMKGEIRRLRRRTAHIDQLDEAFKPFTQRLRQFIDTYDEDKILALIERYVAQ